MLALLALNALAYALPSAPLPLAAMLLDLISLALLGPSLEAAFGRARFAGLCVCGAAAGAILSVTSGEGSGGALAFAAAGATVAALTAYLIRFPRARVISLMLVPFAVTIVEVPAALLLGAWALAQLYIGLAR